MRIALINQYNNFSKKQIKNANSSSNVTFNADVIPIGIKNIQLLKQIQIEMEHLAAIFAKRPNNSIDSDFGKYIVTASSVHCEANPQQISERVYTIGMDFTKGSRVDHVLRVNNQTGQPKLYMEQDVKKYWGPFPIGQARNQFELTEERDFRGIQGLMNSIHLALIEEKGKILKF